MPETRFTTDHEWVRLDGAIATVGITDHAQEQLGDIVFVELPAPGREVAAGEACAVVESVKAASDVFAPLAGRVTETNAHARRRSGPRQPRGGGRGLVLPHDRRRPGRVRRAAGRGGVRETGGGGVMDALAELAALDARRDSPRGISAPRRRDRRDAARRRRRQPRRPRRPRGAGLDPRRCARVARAARRGRRDRASCARSPRATW